MRRVGTRPAVVVLAVGALTVAAGCRGDAPPPASVLDGRPRTPDVRGVVGDVTRQRIEVDGKTYAFGDVVESFSTYDGQLSSVFERPGQYVHVGLDDGKVRWVAAVGLPSGSPPRVYFASEVAKKSGRTLTFSGGTVLEVAPGVAAPARGEVEVRIDVESDLVVEVRPL